MRGQLAPGSVHTGLLHLIGGDQGLASSPTTVDTLLVETGSRYDVIFDFKGHANTRIIMKNIGGDAAENKPGKDLLHAHSASWNIYDAAAPAR